MSIYSDLSKSIGHEERMITYPTLQQVYGLEEKIKNHNSVPCFAAVFEYVRHLHSPKNEDEREILEKLINVFIDTKEKFE